MRFRNTQRLVSREPEFNPCSKIFVELSLAVQSGTDRLWRHKRIDFGVGQTFTYQSQAIRNLKIAR
jgi:hypothetical protein